MHIACQADIKVLYIMPFFFKFLVASLNQSLYLQQLQLDFRHSQLCTLQPNYCKYICCQRFEEFLADFEAGVFSRG